MRRAERELVDPAALDRILQAAQVLFLALRDEPAPYVLPVCFGYEDGVLYVHSARAGTKIDLISRDPMVGFSASTEMRVIPGDAPCRFTSRAESVVGHGQGGDTGGGGRPETRAGPHHAPLRRRDSPPGGRRRPAYEPASLARTCVIAVRIHTMRGKRTG